MVRAFRCRRAPSRQLCPRARPLRCAGRLMRAASGAEVQEIIKSPRARVWGKGHAHRRSVWHLCDRRSSTYCSKRATRPDAGSAGPARSIAISDPGAQGGLTCSARIGRGDEALDHGGRTVAAGRRARRRSAAPAARSRRRQASRRRDLHAPILYSRGHDASEAGALGRRRRKRPCGMPPAAAAASCQRAQAQSR